MRNSCNGRTCGYHPFKLAEGFCHAQPVRIGGMDENPHASPQTIEPRRLASVVARISTYLSMAMIGFGVVMVVLAYYNGDVPEHLSMRWKYYPVFHPYFHSTRLAAFAAVGFAVLGLCFKRSWGSFVLLGFALASVIAHGQWEAHLRS